MLFYNKLISLISFQEMSIDNCIKIELLSLWLLFNKI